jgi:hypothetical protein
MWSRITARPIALAAASVVALGIIVTGATFALSGGDEEPSLVGRWRYGDGSLIEVSERGDGLVAELLELGSVCDLFAKKEGYLDFTAKQVGENEYIASYYIHSSFGGYFAGSRAERIVVDGDALISTPRYGDYRDWAYCGLPSVTRED